MHVTSRDNRAGDKPLMKYIELNALTIRTSKRELSLPSELNQQDECGERRRTNVTSILLEKTSMIQRFAPRAKDCAYVYVFQYSNYKFPAQHMATKVYAQCQT